MRFCSPAAATLLLKHLRGLSKHQAGAPAAGLKGHASEQLRLTPCKALCWGWPGSGGVNVATPHQAPAQQRPMSPPQAASGDSRSHETVTTPDEKSKPGVCGGGGAADRRAELAAHRRLERPDHLRSSCATSRRSARRSRRPAWPPGARIPSPACPTPLLRCSCCRSRCPWKLKHTWPP